MSKNKEFWLMFFKDPATGSLHCTGYPHNSIGDYKKNPYFIGAKKIQVNMEELEK